MFEYNSEAHALWYTKLCLVFIMSVKMLDLSLILESVICQRHFSLFYLGCCSEPFDRIRINHSRRDFQSGFISLMEAKRCVFYLPWTFSVQECMMSSYFTNHSMEAYQVCIKLITPLFFVVHISVSKWQQYQQNSLRYCQSFKENLALY